jgi:DNA-binding MarR family transcriptional regulator
VATPAPRNDAQTDRSGERYDDVAWVAHYFRELGLGDADGIELMASIARTSRLMISRMEETLSDFSLGLSQYLVLMTILLSESAERRLSNISRHMMVHPTTVTVVVDQLEKKGLVKRKGDPSDRRVTLAKLTRSGEAVATGATVALSKTNFGFPSLSKQRARQLINELAELRSEAGDK